MLSRPFPRHATAVAPGAPADAAAAGARAFPEEGRAFRFRTRRVNRAFSLVEAVISIGIVSFAMLGIFGMIPVGLNNFQSALQLTVESSIVQGVTGELQRTDFSTLSAMPATNRYYDEQGKPVTDPAAAVYTVNISSPTALDADNLISKDAAKSVVITVSTRSRVSATNSYAVILAGGQ